MKYLILAISGFILGSSMIYFWYHEMFSDDSVGEFGRAFDSGRGKNLTALSQPAAGLFFVLVALALIGPMIDPYVFDSRHGHSPFWSYWTAVFILPSMLFMFITLIGFIPFTLPEWMYPEYHALKREERRRREAAQRGEAEDSENRFPFLHDDGVYASQLGHIDIDITEAVSPLRTSHGTRPTRAHRRPHDGGDTPTARSILVQTDNAEGTEQPSMPSEASSRSSQEPSSEE